MAREANTERLVWCTCRSRRTPRSGAEWDEARSAFGETDLFLLALAHLANDYPMRPEAAKCADCDFAAFCSKQPEQFEVDTVPPPIHLPEGLEARMALAFSKFTPDPMA